MEYCRRAPAGGRGKGAALRITDTAARSSAAEPDPRATDTEANPPLLAMAKAIVAVPVVRTRGLPAREMRRMT